MRNVWRDVEQGSNCTSERLDCEYRENWACPDAEQSTFDPTKVYSARETTIVLPPSCGSSQLSCLSTKMYPWSPIQPKNISKPSKTKSNRFPIRFTPVYDASNVTTDITENVRPVATITMREYHWQRK